MAKYMIHACPKREWYVNDFLIPSMTEQGIEKDDISVYLDSDDAGNLESCMKAFESVPDDKDGVWHLQDDVVISKRFRELTEKYDSGIVCGHAWWRHKNTLNSVGHVDIRDMWFSFTCIRIPNQVARGCARFYRDTILQEKQYEPWIKARRYDDTVFNLYLQTHGTTERILNLVPNLVAHIDYLIGGTVANVKRYDEPQEPYFDEPETMEKLIEWVNAEVR